MLRKSAAWLASKMTREHEKAWFSSVGLALLDTFPLLTSADGPLTWRWNLSCAKSSRNHSQKIPHVSADPSCGSAKPRTFTQVRGSDRDVKKKLASAKNGLRATAEWSLNRGNISITGLEKYTCLPKMSSKCCCSLTALRPYDGLGPRIVKQPTSIEIFFKVSTYRIFANVWKDQIKKKKTSWGKHSPVFPLDEQV